MVVILKKVIIMSCHQKFTWIFNDLSIMLCTGNFCCISPKIALHFFSSSQSWHEACKYLAQKCYYKINAPQFPPKLFWKKSKKKKIIWKGTFQLFIPSYAYIMEIHPLINSCPTVPIINFILALYTFSTKKDKKYKKSLSAFILYYISQESCLMLRNLWKWVDSCGSQLVFFLEEIITWGEKSAFSNPFTQSLH